MHHSRPIYGMHHRRVMGHPRDNTILHQASVAPDAHRRYIDELPADATTPATDMCGLHLCSSANTQRRSITVRSFSAETVIACFRRTFAPRVYIPIQLKKRNYVQIPLRLWYSLS